jgi:hypothetical protein
VGAVFYAGWQDLYAIRGVSYEGQRVHLRARARADPAGPGPDAADRIADVVPRGFRNPVDLAENLTEEELEWYDDLCGHPHSWPCRPTGSADSELELGGRVAAVRIHANPLRAFPRKRVPRASA